jgi:hypothetical protein
MPSIIDVDDVLPLRFNVPTLCELGFHGLRASLMLPPL